MLPSLLSSSSPVTVRVEKATSHLLIAPDWTMNMDICDSINTDPLQAKDVVKAVKKRLQHKNPRVQFLALTLLETMIKNCGDFVHFQVVDREVLHDMVKIVRKSTDMQVRDKILVLLDSWQEAFGGPGGKYPQYYHAYAELKTSGIMFPQHQKDAALIYTPVSHTFPPQVGHAIPSSSIQRQDEVMNSEMGNLSLSDLKNIRSVTELFIDMLMAVNPENRQAVNDEVIADLANQCRMNQKKVMHLISSTENEELLGEALVLNDNLQYALARHDAIASGSPLPLEPPHASLSTSSVATPTLTHQQFDDQEVEEDDGNRDAKLKSTGDHLASSNQSDITTATSPSGASEASSSVASNALVLLDPPTPVSASRKEDDMIDFLGLVLSTNPPPQTPPASVPPSNHSQNPFSDSPNPQQQVSSPQPVMVSQGYAANNSYVAPWAQPAVAPLPAPPPPIPPQQPVRQYPYNYQTSPWNPSPGVSSNPFLPNSSVQFPAFPPPPPPPPPVRPFQYPIYQSGTSAAPVASFHSPPPPVPEPIQYSKAIQNYKPLGSGQAQWNANNSNQTGSSSSSTMKSYFMPDKLFDDLIELRNPDGTLKSKNASTLLGNSGQGMARERK